MHRQVQNGGCDSEAGGALTDLGCFLAPNNGRLVSNLLGPSLSRSRPLQPHSLRFGRGVPLALATACSSAVLLGKRADRWFRLSSFLFGAGVLSGLLQGVQVRGAWFFFLSAGSAEQHLTQVGPRWQDWVGDDACLLAWLCDCSAAGAGGLEKKTTSPRNGKGRKLCWAGSVENGDVFLSVSAHSLILSLTSLKSPEGPFNRPHTSKAGTFGQGAGGRRGRRCCAVT